MGTRKKSRARSASGERLTFFNVDPQIDRYMSEQVNRSPLALRARIFFLVPIAPSGRYGLVSDVLRWRSGLSKGGCLSTKSSRTRLG